MNSPDVVYAGFWIRFLAFLIDTALALAVVVPLLFAVYGSAVLTDPERTNEPLGLLVQLGIPAVATVIFWLTRKATPGKMIFSAQVVDAKTGEKPTATQSVIRYIGYYLCVLTGGLGFIWIAFDPRKQGLHDKLSGTVVVRKTSMPR